jgi:hypothetical protein
MPNVATSSGPCTRGVQQDLVGLAANLEVALGSVDSDPAAAKALLDELQREARRA